MSDMAREIIYPSFVILLIASVWALGWEKSQTDAAERGFWPPIAENNWIDYDYEEPAAPALTSTLDPRDE